jgi:hypothetical protein
MSATLARVRELAQAGEALVSEHAARELDNDDIYPPEVLAGLSAAVVVEDYPSHPRGPCVLVLQGDAAGRPIHVVWGIPKGRRGPAVLVTAYRPDPTKWSADLTKRVQS